ncbi:MAG: acetate--CoA ligase family protein [Pseudomonadota bacterium]
MSTHDLRALFYPRNIAIIGASPDRTRIRGHILEFLAHGEYRGQIFPVNPSYREIDGIECFASIAAANAKASEPIDLAVIVIPAAGVLAELERCAAARVRRALIVSSGFAEGGGNSETQARIAAIARSTGMRVIGPNSEGFFSALSKVRATFSPTVASILDAEKAQPRVSAKRVGVVAQSGGMGFGVMHRGHADGLAFSHVISTGNEADIDLADCLDFMVDDPDTDIIALYLECVRNAALFEAACARAAARDKPIVAIKVGRGQAGQRATQSHTGSIAGWGAAYDAVFAKYGLISAGDLSEAIAILGVLATCPRIAGNRIGVLTGSGGAGALISDVLERNGLVLPVLGAALQQAILAPLPSYATAQNPIHITAGATRSGALIKSADALLACDEIDLLVSVHSLTSESSMAFEPRELVRGARISGKPVTCYCYTAPSKFGRGKMADAGVFVHTDLQLMAAALAKVLTRRQQIARAATRQPHAIDHALIERASLAVTEVLRNTETEVLCEYQVKALLRQCGISASSEMLCCSADDAVAAAERLGYPVALKIQSPKITHKTEIGGVRLGVTNADAVRSAYADVLTAAACAAPQAVILGVLVQAMAPSGDELIVGMIQDSTFGPLMMVGLGGIAVELYKDVAYFPAPLSAAEAEALLRSLKSSALFDGFRGKPVVDLQPLAQLISQVSCLVAARPDIRPAIAELELNPVIVHADGSGLTIADALLRRAAKD